MVTTTNLISYWKLDEDAANTSVVDAHASNDGTGNVNTSNYSVAGILNTAFLLNGTSEYVDISGESDFRFDADTEDFSIACWVKLAANNSFILDKRDGSQDGWVFYTQVNNKLEFVINSTLITADTELATDGTWYHVGISVDRNGNGTFYVNGASDGGGSVSGITMATTTSMVLGARSFSSKAAFFDGTIDEVGVWSEALVEQDFVDLYNSGSGLAYPFTGGGTDYTETLSETMSMSDGIGSTSQFNRSLTDSQTLLDNLGRTSQFNRSLSDTVTIADLIAAGQEFLESFSETLSLSDSLASSVGFNRLLSDSQSILDSLVKKSEFNRDLSDTQPISDSLAKISEFNRLLSEIQVISDDLNSSSEFNRSLNDSQTITDDLTSSSQINKSLSDTQPISDNLTKISEFNRLINELQVISDDLNTSIGYNKSIADLQSISDDLNRRVSYNRNLADTQTISDNLVIAGIITNIVTQILRLGLTKFNNQLIKDDSIIKLRKGGNLKLK